MILKFEPIIASNVLGDIISDRVFRCQPCDSFPFINNVLSSVEAATPAFSAAVALAFFWVKTFEE
jgi:hypothetical protein